LEEKKKKGLLNVFDKLTFNEVFSSDDDEFDKFEKEAKKRLQK
jgi:hypothetical protein